MSETVTVQKTKRGLLVPESILREWQDREIEVIKEPQRIIIQPKSPPPSEHEKVLKVLETAGLLLPAEPSPSPHESLSDQKVDELQHRFGQGRPLSEIIIEDRGERW